MSGSTLRRHAKFVVARTYRATPKQVWDLWTTKEGFESWWAPEGCRVEVREIDARPGGVLRYDMIADTPETIVAMQDIGLPLVNANHGRFTEFKPRSRLVLTWTIDFVPGIDAYETEIAVNLTADGESVRMVVEFSGMHRDDFTKLQEDAFAGVLARLDARFSHGERSG
ncbi:MAG: SRPBCC domain-containing protein [Terricaulis sp.]